MSSQFSTCALLLLFDICHVHLEPQRFSGHPYNFLLLQKYDRIDILCLKLSSLSGDKYGRVESTKILFLSQHQKGTVYSTLLAKDSSPLCHYGVLQSFSACTVHFQSSKYLAKGSVQLFKGSHKVHIVYRWFMQNTNCTPFSDAHLVVWLERS